MALTYSISVSFIRSLHQVTPSSDNSSPLQINSFRVVFVHLYPPASLMPTYSPAAIIISSIIIGIIISVYRVCAPNIRLYRLSPAVGEGIARALSARSANHTAPRSVMMMPCWWLFGLTHSSTFSFSK